jgi:hypothetical protein
MTWLIGCHQAGPDSVETSRSNYNIAIQQTSSEQLLLNLARLRYRDTPFFMEVASVSTSFDFDASASATSLEGQVRAHKSHLSHELQNAIIFR